MHGTNISEDSNFSFYQRDFQKYGHIMINGLKLRFPIDYPSYEIDCELHSKLGTLKQA